MKEGSDNDSPNNDIMIGERSPSCLDNVDEKDLNLQLSCFDRDLTMKNSFNEWDTLTNRFFA